MQSPGAALRLDQALGRAYRFIAKRDRTVAEVRGCLERSEFEGETIEAALSELSELGYLDDERFARRFAEDRRNLDSWGDARIARRLRELGVAGDLVAAALADRGDAPGELESAIALLTRRFAQPAETARDRNRALGVLMRKGYSADLALDAIRAHAATGAR